MTVPTQTALEVPQQGLGAALGLGLQQGGQLGLQGLLQRYKASQGMTEFQRLSTDLRAKEQKRKTETAMTQEFLKLGDPFMKASGISANDVLPLSRSAVKIMEEENVAPATAMDEAVNRFKIQKSTIKESKLPKYNSSKAKSLKQDVVNSIKKGNLTNRTLINKDLTTKKWPAKDRIEILNSLKQSKNIKTPQKTKTIEPGKGKLKQLSKQELSVRYKKMPGKTHKKKLENLKKILTQEGYSIQGL